ncbi:MAG: EAL domain-containing protein [Acidimicrobiales bacterium]
MRLSWNRFLGAGLAIYALGVLTGPTGLGVASQIVGWAAVVALFQVGRSHENAERIPWFWLAGGGATILAGGILRVVHGEISGTVDPFPSWGEPFFVLGYLAVFLGLVSLIRLRTVVRNPANVIDALIVAAAVGLIAWITILAPYARDETIALVERGLAVQYSVLTLMLIGATVRLAVGPGFRAPSYYFFAAAMASIFVSDTFATLQTTAALQSDLYGLVAPLAYVFTGTAALHPSVTRLTATPAYEVPRLGWKRIALLASALLMGPAVLVVQSIRDGQIDVPVVVAGWVALSLLVLARLAALIWEEERTAARERVLRDLGSVLVVGGTSDEMYTAALWAILELADGLPDGRASVVEIDGDQARILTSVGVRADLANGRQFALDTLPDTVRPTLAQRSVAVFEQVPALDLPVEVGEGLQGSVVVAPIVTRGETSGALVVSSRAPLHHGVVSALSSLAMEVSLAIESAALNEDLHRRKSDRRFRSLVENSSELLLVLDHQGHGTFTTPVVERLLGRSEQYLTGPLPEDLVHPADVEIFADLVASAPGSPVDDEPVELRLLHADGSYHWFESRARDLSADPEVGGVVITARDVTDRKAAEQRLARSEARFRALVQNSSDVVAVIDEAGTISYVSPAVIPMLGFRPEELVGTNVLRLLPADEVNRAMKLLDGVADGPFEQENLEMRLRDSDGSWRTVDITVSDLRTERAVQGIVLNARDVTVRRALEEDLQHKALHDELTGLANRVYFTERLTRALARPESRLDQVSVLFVDLDDFKEINDSLGHQVGDQLLQAIAERLRTCLRVADIAARLGGDEFAVLLEDVYGESEVFAVAERILVAVSQPYTVAGRELTVSASIGIVIDDDRSSSAEALLRGADVALYLAKDRGKGRYELFHEASHGGAFERLELKGALATAIDEGGLELHYQPIVDLHTGVIVGCEALVRWNHPDRGLLPPSAFVSLAEESGLIVRLGTWVLHEACRQLGEWNRTVEGTDSLKVSVNLSVRQLASPDLLTDVADAIDSSGIPADRLTLEITESMVMRDDPDTLERLGQLRSRGISLAIDDFGTGYSSLGYIQQFPLDVIKIDRSFVNRLEGSAGTRQVVQTVLDLAASLGAEVVAEGIETSGELHSLTKMGCRLGQGFYFSRPIPADQFAALIGGDVSRRPVSG